MEEELKELAQYLQGDTDTVPTPDELRSLMAAYPYFAAPVAAMLRIYGATLDEGERTRLRVLLSVLLGGSGPAIQAVDRGEDSSFYPEPENSRPDTDNALDTFFATYGKTTPEEEAMLERLIFNPVPDYADLLAHEEGRDPIPDADDDIPDVSDLAARLARPEPDKAPAKPEHETAAADKPRPAPSAAQPPTGGDDSLLSESLAKIFIKQGRYERAYEIISNLNLNYPEKSIYFADQLRFLRKIILIKQKNQSSPEPAAHPGNASADGQ